MLSAKPCLLCLFLLSLSAAAAVAQNEGRDDLDKATQLQLSAESIADVEQVVALCESALQKGLDAGDTEFAKQLLVGALWKHATRLTSAIFDQRRPDPRWQTIRRLASSDLEKLLQHDPQFVDAYVLRARLESLPGGSREQALAAVNRAIELFAGDANKRSQALLQRALLRETDEDKLADLNSAIEADPSHVEAWQSRAAFYIGRGELEKAVADFQGLLANDQENVAAHQALAEALANLQRYDLALEHVAKAIELAPQSSLSYTLRARLHEQKNDLDAALADLDQALRLDPNDLFALLSRSRLHYVRQELPAAREDVERVLQLQPGAVQAILLRSAISAAEQRFEDAIRDVELLVRDDPNNADLQLQLATLYINDQRPRKAIALLTRIIEADQGNWLALRTRADALLSVGKHADAVSDYEKALLLEPEDDGILNNLAWVLATSPVDEVRNSRRSIELGTKACEVTKYEKPHILSTLAAGYAEAGDFETALKWSTKAVELGREDLKEQIEQLQQELESYKNRKPWRELQEVKEKLDPPRRVVET